MTETKILTAWIACHTSGNCSNCPLEGKDRCTDFLIDETIKAFNRKNEEIAEKDKVLARMKANNAFLMLPQFERQTVVESVRSGAIKEFLAIVEKLDCEVRDGVISFDFKDFRNVIDQFIRK